MIQKCISESRTPRGKFNEVEIISCILSTMLFHWEQTDDFNQILRSLYDWMKVIFNNSTRHISTYNGYAWQTVCRGQTA